MCELQQLPRVLEDHWSFHGLRCSLSTTRAGPPPSMGYTPSGLDRLRGNLDHPTPNGELLICLDNTVGSWHQQFLLQHQRHHFLHLPDWLLSIRKLTSEPVSSDSCSPVSSTGFCFRFLCSGLGRHCSSVPMCAAPGCNCSCSCDWGSASTSRHDHLPFLAPEVACQTLWPWTLCFYISPWVILKTASLRGEPRSRSDSGRAHHQARAQPPSQPPSFSGALPSPPGWRGGPRWAPPSGAP